MHAKLAPKSTPLQLFFYILAHAYKYFCDKLCTVNIRNVQECLDKLQNNYENTLQMNEL